MLDMDHGVFPNVTYANTTSKNAIKYVKRFGLAPEIFYVTRCYSTRHGNGWMPNENAPELINTEEEINVYNEWQTDFRIGEIDYDLLNQAIRFDQLYYDKDYIRANLVMGCMDQRPGFDPKTYKFEGIDYFWINDSPHAGNLKD
jgi:adenylosuccinate synthase